MFEWIWSPTRECFTHLETPPLPEMVENFYLSSANMAIEHWGFLILPHLLWHGTSIYNGLFREPVTLTPIAERLPVEMSLPVITTSVCRDWDSNTQPSASGANALFDCATAAVSILLLSKNCTILPILRIFLEQILRKEFNRELISYWLRDIRMNEILIKLGYLHKTH